MTVPDTHDAKNLANLPRLRASASPLLRVARPLILGIGNVLLGDEGIGVEAVHDLERNGFAEWADLVDGGTGGFHLLGLFGDYTRILLIDAALDGKPAGTVGLRRPRFADDFPPSLAAHDIGLKDLIEAAALLGSLPQVDLVTISISGPSAVTLELSAPVREALPRVRRMVQERLHGPSLSQTSEAAAAESP